jgi:hypothetical protein
MCIAKHCNPMQKTDLKPLKEFIQAVNGELE